MYTQGHPPPAPTPPGHPQYGFGGRGGPGVGPRGGAGGQGGGRGGGEKCSSCGSQPDQLFLVQTDPSRPEVPMCERCYKESFACVECKKPLDGPYVIWEGKKAHPPCGEKLRREAEDQIKKCDSCNRPLSGIMYPHEGKSICENCFTRIYRCSGCGRPTTDEFLTYELDGRAFKCHQECKSLIFCGNCGSNYHDRGRFLITTPQGQKNVCLSCSTQIQQQVASYRPPPQVVTGLRVESRPFEVISVEAHAIQPVSAQVEAPHIPVALAPPSFPSAPSTSSRPLSGPVPIHLQQQQQQQQQQPPPSFHSQPPPSFQQPQQLPPPSFHNQPPQQPPFDPFSSIPVGQNSFRPPPQPYPQQPFPVQQQPGFQSQPGTGQSSASAIHPPIKGPPKGVPGVGFSSVGPPPQQQFPGMTSGSAKPIVVPIAQGPPPPQQMYGNGQVCKKCHQPIYGEMVSAVKAQCFWHPACFGPGPRP